MPQSVQSDHVSDHHSARQAQASSFSRMPELDGLRGIAVLAVMTNHFLSFAEGYGVFHVPTEPLLHWATMLQYSGWLGVDLFYALSGFLITGILADSRQRQGYFRNFYIRRSLRIFPAYYLLLILWPIVEVFFSPGNRGALDPNYPVWLWTYTTNVLITVNGWTSMPVPLRHLWSLAVEEQFYLIWPLVIYFLDRRKAIYLCAILMLIGPGLRIFLDHQFHPLTAAYVLMPARLDSLAAGALMALLWREVDATAALLRAARLVALAAFGLLAMLFVAHDGLLNAHSFDRTWGLSISATCFACLILLGAADDGPAALKRLLRGKMLSWFGNYSYALYLWHPPVCLFFYSTRLMTMLAHAYSQHSMWLLVLLLYAIPMMGSIAVAYVSWHAWEQPFLRLKRYFKAEHLPAPEPQSA